MIDNIIGLSLQTFIWISLGYLYFDFNTKNIYLFPYNIIVYALAISVFVYFFEFLFRSKLYGILTKYRKYTKSISTMIGIVSKAKLSLEVYTKAFHYKNNKEILTKNEIIALNFTEVEDLTKISEIEAFYENQNAKNKLIIMDIDLHIDYDEKSNYLLLEKRVNDIKTELSLKDKYYEVQTGYSLEDLSKKENVFLIESCKNSFLYNPYLLILSYIFLIGEFYRIIIEMNLLYCLITLNKNIKGVDISKKDRIEKIFNSSNDSFLNDDEDKDMIVFDTKTDSLLNKNQTSRVNDNLKNRNDSNVYLDINENIKDSTLYCTTKSKEEDKFYITPNYDIKSNIYNPIENERRTLEKKIKPSSIEKTTDLKQNSNNKETQNDLFRNKNTDFSNQKSNVSTDKNILITNHNPLFEIEQINKEHIENTKTDSDFKNINFSGRSKNTDDELYKNSKNAKKENLKSGLNNTDKSLLQKQVEIPRLDIEDLQIDDESNSKIPHGKNFSLSSFDAMNNHTESSILSLDNLELNKNMSIQNNNFRGNNRFNTEVNVLSKSTKNFPSANKSKQNITTSNESDEEDVDYSEELNENIFDIFENSNQINIKALEQRKSKKSITQVDKLKDKQKYKDKMKKIFAKGVYINPYSTTNTSNYEKK